MGYLVFAALLIIGISSLTAYVSANMTVARHRADMLAATQFAEGGVAVACYDLEKAYLASNGTTSNVVSRLCSNSPTRYVINTASTTPSRFVLERVITNVFPNQPVSVQLWFTNAVFFNKGQVVASAQVGKSIQTVRPTVQARYSRGAAIISDHKGTFDLGSSKNVAKRGNVCLNGVNEYNPKASKYGPTVIDGAILANGAVNADSASTQVIMEHLWGTPDQIPDYTSPGSADQLFDFGRLIAVADRSPGPTTNHFRTIKQFIDAQKHGQVLEGVIVVDINEGDKNLNSFNPTYFPYGINIRGTLVFNFIPTNKWSITDKIVNTAAMNINPANLSGLDPKDPSTFTSGYPPTYSNPFKQPHRINIVPLGYQNFSANDDLPALAYNNAILDIHGPCNISGVIYSPAFVEIENHGGIQYIKGTIIGGNGIFIDNNGKNYPNIVSFDPNALDQLATSGNKGKAIVLNYWER